MNPCHTWNLYCNLLKILVELGNSHNKLPRSFQIGKFTSQKEVNNKIYTTYSDLYHKTFLNLDWPNSVPKHRTICWETLGKFSAWSNNRIENYDYWRKTRQ